MRSGFPQRGLLVLVVGLALGSGGCAAWKSAPESAPFGDQAPVGLRSLEMASAQGYQAVLLRLTRLPTMVRHSSSSNPARITLQAWGPNTGGDLPERVLEQDDPLVQQVRVSRKGGTLHVVLDLHTAVPPPYIVNEMADWVMIRFGES